MTPESKKTFSVTCFIASKIDKETIHDFFFSQQSMIFFFSLSLKFMNFRINDENYIFSIRFQIIQLQTNITNEN